VNMEHLRELNIPERTVIVQIDKAKCIGSLACGECLKKCPASVFITYPKARVKGEVCNDWDIAADDTFCWGCGVCNKICPENAITISELVK
jgi:ferredoxin